MKKRRTKPLGESTLNSYEHSKNKPANEPHSPSPKSDKDKLQLYQAIFQIQRKDKEVPQPEKRSTFKENVLKRFKLR